MPEELYGGFPVSNFAIAAQAPEDGSMFGHVIRNTGKLGGWLIKSGSIDVTVCKDGRKYSLSEFKGKDLHRDFPVVVNRYQDNRIVKASLKMEAFCPLTIQNAEETALPALMLQIDVAAAAPEEFSFVITPKPAKGESFTITADAASVAGQDGAVEIPVSLAKGQASRIRVVIGFHDPTWVSAKRFDSAAEVAEYIFPRWDVLRNNTAIFDASMPYTGDGSIDKYLQYYVLPSLILTRMSARDEALTMGYCELNQRDSFWTSWMHLALFKDLEWKMITESYGQMRASGKIPTCILPEIERWDDIDINLFLILRTARFYAMYHNKEQIKELWPDMCRCMDWTIGRDISHEGLPEQVSFWCDWKDVDYMSGRKYSPFVAMLYLAALDQMQKIALINGDKERSEHYKAVYDKAYDKVNRDEKDGGLWNGRYYAQVWRDGVPREYIAQDQMVGVLYGVVPEDRAQSIINSLNEMSLTQYGVCNMWPYMDDACDAGGVYHNGAMWPWTSFMDCWGRIAAGRKDEAVGLMKTIFKADLVDSGDYVPNEHINTVTGENLGAAIQGWNADLFGVFYFGLKHTDMKFKL